MSIEIHSAITITEMIDIISEYIMINMPCYLYVYTNNVSSLYGKLLKTFALTDLGCCFQNPTRLVIACVNVLIYYNNRLKDNEYCFFEVSES